MENEKTKLIATSAATGAICGILLTSATLLPKTKYHLQTRDVIGNPNAPAPNDTYIDTPTGRFFYAIDSEPIEKYINKR